MNPLNDFFAKFDFSVLLGKKPEVEKSPSLTETYGFFCSTPTHASQQSFDIIKYL